MEDLAGARVNWKSVATYYAIACLWSWPFFWRRDILHIPDTPITSISKLLIHWGLMWGPAIGALVCLVVFQRSHRRVITLGGNSWGRSVLFYAAPFDIQREYQPFLAEWFVRAHRGRLRALGLA